MKHKYLNHEERLKLVVPYYDPAYIKDRIQALNMIDEYFKEMPEFATHHVWEEEGQRYSSWSFGNQKTSRIYTGDGGAIMMMNALRKELQGYVK